MLHLFLQLASILVLATGLGIVARFARQPLIVAYIFTGIVISIFGFFSRVDRQLLEVLSNLGIAFLLFLVGVELKLEDLKYVGKAAIYTGIGQIIFTALLGFILISALGFSTVASVYMSIALTFSSTVIIIKLLAEKHNLQSLYGKIAVGFLLVQDFVAILALMILSGFGPGQTPTLIEISTIIFKGILLLLFTIAATKYGLRFLFKWTSTSTELLFVSAIAWAFLMAALSEQAGFSVAIGAFLAGVAIASSPYRIQISARVKPLRDFFIIIFFILLGASLSAGASSVLLSQVIVLSLFILISKPLIVFATMLTLKFRNRTSFLASSAVAQISEFSLILMAVGQNLGHVKSNEVSLVSAVGIVTITLSSYFILYGEKIYKFAENPLSKVFPQKSRDPYVTNRESLKDHIILVGGEQMGWDVLKYLKNKVEEINQIVIVDFNPELITNLKADGYNAVFGDVSDPELLEELELGKAKLIIITDPDITDSEQIIKFAKDKNYKGPIITTAYWTHEAIKLYEGGADYVVVPEAVGGKHVARIISENWEDLSKIKKQKSKNFEELIGHKVF